MIWNLHCRVHQVDTCSYDGNSIGWLAARSCHDPVLRWLQFEPAPFDCAGPLCGTSGAACTRARCKGYENIDWADYTHPQVCLTSPLPSIQGTGSHVSVCYARKATPKGEYKSCWGSGGLPAYDPVLLWH